MRKRPPNLAVRLWNRFTGEESRRLTTLAHRATRYAVAAAARSGASPGWNGIQSTRDEDAGNKESLRDLAMVLQRSQDLDINNPDIRGFNRARTAQIVGAHVRFKSNPRHDEVGFDEDAPALIAVKGQIDRTRAIHSRTGGFDSTGKNRSEGEQQVRAVLTALIHGACIVHRVWRPENPILPLSLELIPGVRISTPFQRMADPLLSHGIEYSDEHRTRVVAYHVRRVSKSRGDSMVPDYVWDRLPVEDCSLLELGEPAGMDRAMPLSVAVVRMARNRGEMIEAMVASARAQAMYYAVTEVAEGASPFQNAADDSDEVGPAGNFTKMADVMMLYTQHGETVNWNSAKLPEPDLVGFDDIADCRMARGLSASKSRFTREVNNSWAGGRLEDQQDDPIIDQYRQTFVSAWQRVNVWFMESLWLSGKVELAGYSSATATAWSEFRAQFPGKLHINPADTMAAREKGYLLKTTSPQQACEEDGRDLSEQLDQWGEAVKMARAAEIKHGLEDGELAYCIIGKTVSTTAGDEIASAQPIPEVPGDAGKPVRKTSKAGNRLRRLWGAA